MSKTLTRILKLLAYLRPEAMTPGAMVVATIAVDAGWRPVQILGHFERGDAIYRSAVVQNDKGETDVLFTRVGRVDFLLWRIKRTFAGFFE